MEIENLNLQKQINEMIDKIYPIGSYYETSDPNFDPNVEWGGAWIKDSKGLVTIGAYANGESEDSSYVNTYIKQGEIIGENKHQLTINEIPSHNHRVNEGNDGPGKYPNWGNESGWGVVAQSMNGNGGQTHTAYTGNGESHNNIQPSIGVYRWHRITPSFTLEYTDRNSTPHSETILTEGELKTRIQEIKTFQEGQTVYMNLKTCKIISNGIKIKDCSNLFENCQGVTQIDLSDFDTSETTTMERMFYACNSLQEINLNGINTSKVINMSRMFSSCNNLKSIDLSNFDTGNVTAMNSMFYSCGNLTSLDLSSFNTSNIINMSAMFSRCHDLVTLDLSNFDTSNVTNMNSMFTYCTSLNTLDLSNFDFSNVSGTTSMFYEVPSNCLIYVKDQTSKNFILNIRNDFTNIEIANNQE